MEETYSPKEVVEKTGLSIYTLRYYESIGLLDPVERASNSHRRYTQADLTRLGFLKRLKATGMPLGEMAHYVELFRQGEPTIRQRRLILETHRRQVQTQIELLYETLEVLDGKIENYCQQEAILATK